MGRKWKRKREGTGDSKVGKNSKKRITRKLKTKTEGNH